MVCGADRARLDAVKPGQFDRHVNAEHNPHHYVFLLHKLEAQVASLSHPLRDRNSIVSAVVTRPCPCS